jgi:hypothetical protein
MYRDILPGHRKSGKKMTCLPYNQRLEGQYVEFAMQDRKAGHPGEPHSIFGFLSNIADKVQPYNPFMN